MLSSYRNLLLTGIWVAGLALFFETPSSRTVLSVLAPCGRTSLTCYVMQGLVGAPLFYGFGFGLFRYLGPFYSMLLGCVLFACQCVAARLWLQRFTQGPREWSWRKLTLLKLSNVVSAQHKYGSPLPGSAPQ